LCDLTIDWSPTRNAASPVGLRGPRDLHERARGVGRRGARPSGGDGDEALVLIDALTEEAARALLGDDPSSNTILRIASIVERTILLDSRPR
jgi:hypothetical protein